MLPIKALFTALSTLVGLLMAVTIFLPIHLVMGLFSALGVIYRGLREHVL